MNMKIKRALVAMFIIAAMLVGMVGAISPTVAHAEEPSNEVTQYFSDHYKDVERAIDPDHVYFGKLKAANDLDGMKKIVALLCLALLLLPVLAGAEALQPDRAASPMKSPRE